MKKFLIPIVILVLLGLMIFQGIGVYNGLVEDDENVNNEWAQVQSQYQRRLDLIPNLVEVVKGYADVEERILIGVTEARAKGMSGMMAAQQQAESGEGVDIAAFQRSQRPVSRALGGLFGYAENYPELKSSTLFSDLQAQLEGTENRISVARDEFNEIATVYNKKVRKFPANFYASILGFDERDLFEADEEAADAPEVDFSS